MTDEPTPAEKVRNLCDSIHDALSNAEHPPSPKEGRGGDAAGSRPPMPVSILDAKLDLKQKLSSWALLISEEAEVIIDADDNSYSIAAWIYTKADWLDEHPALDDFLDEIRECVKALRRPYANNDQRRLVYVFNGTPIYAWPWEETVTLPDGRTERTITLREALKAQTVSQTLPAPNVSAVLREIFDMDVPADTIRKAAKRGTLEKHEDGFNVGEVKKRFDTPGVTIASGVVSA